MTDPRPLLPDPRTDELRRILAAEYRKLFAALAVPRDMLQPTTTRAREADTMPNE